MFVNRVAELSPLENNMQPKIPPHSILCRGLAINNYGAGMRQYGTGPCGAVTNRSLYKRLSKVFHHVLRKFIQVPPICPQLNC